MTRLAPVFAMLAVPAFAGDYDALRDATSMEALLAAMALCIEHGQEPETFAWTLRVLGWTVEKNDDFGTWDAYPKDGDLWVMVSQTGDFCAVAHESVGTPIAVHAIMQFLPSGAPTEPTGFSADLGCEFWTIAPGVTAELTSSGNDPVCNDHNNSAIRFTFNK